MIIRSPKSWLSVFRYGVSPQPEQAPENSNSGWSADTPLTVSWRTFVRSISGMVRKCSKPVLSSSRCSRAETRSSDLWLGSLLETAGQTSTQIPQPVQSSAAMAMLSWWSGRSRDLKDLLWKPSGALSSCSFGKILIRSAACGQVTAHLPQSVHRSGSQIGRSWAIVEAAAHYADAEHLAKVSHGLG